MIALLLLLGACTFDEGPEVPEAPTLPEGTRSVDGYATLLAGPGPEAELGASLAAGDFDGDGRLDLAAGAPGRDSVAIFTSLSGDPTWIDGPAGSGFGAALTAGDLDGDGRDQLIIGAPQHGEVDEETGLAAGAVFVHDLETLEFMLPGPVAGDCFGAALDAADVDDDGLADLLVGAPCRGSYRYEDPSIELSILAQGAGLALLLPGPDLDTPLATFPGGEDFEQSGSAVLLADLDGGGPDPIVGAPDYFGAQWVNPAARGQARAWSGDLRGELHPSAAFLTVRGGCCGSDLFDETGSSLAAADLDGDGHGELLVGAPEAIDFGIFGAAWLVQGPAAGELDGLGTTVLAAPPDDQGESGGDVGRALAAGFDLDSDGIPELAVAGPTDSRAVDGGGAVAILEGLPSGFTELFSGGTVLTGTSSNQDLGAALAHGDFDGDGRDELAIGAPGDRTSGHRAGGVFVVDLSR